MRQDRLFVLVLLLLLILFAKVSIAQNNSFRKVNQLDCEVEVLLNSAAKHMIIFILTQNENEYHTCMKKIHSADTIQKFLLVETKQLKGLTRKIQDCISDDRVYEFLSYKDETIKSLILSEEKELRIFKVRFKGKVYKLSKESKELFENFISYYPAN